MCTPGTYLRTVYFRLLLAVLAVCVFGIGCGEISYDPPDVTYYGATNTCKRSADCPDGYECATIERICVSTRGVANRKLYLRITPPGDVPNTLTVTFDADGKETVAYGEKRSLSVQVMVQDIISATALRIASQIVVTDLQGVPGEPLQRTTVEVSEDSSATLSLLEGEARYRVEVTPKSSKECPPKVFEKLSVVWDEEQKTTMFVDADGVPLPQDDGVPVLQMDEGEELKGHILRGSQPTAGLTVQVVDPYTGVARSTRGVTGCLDSDSDKVCGDFTLRKFAEDTPYHLKIWKPEDPAYPSTLVPSTSGTVGDGDNDDVTFNLPSLSGPVRFGARVEGPRSLSSGTVVYDGLPDCLVVLKTEEDTVFLNAKTDETGNIISLGTDPRFYLYPGFYQILILPPATTGETIEAYAPLIESRRIESTGDAVENQVFLLDYRYWATVRVSANGETVPGAVIEAEPLSGDAIPAVSRAEPDGTHRLWLEPGSWRLTVATPTESGFAYAIREEVIEKVEEPAGRPAYIVLEDIDLGLPAAAEVQLSSETVDLTGASVEWFEKWSDGPVLLVARSTVDASGRTVGLLPVR